ncbi:Calmodulin [Rhynchospora pubera]|uniref:Calmodulin n=1 Tax=Rhynchospora pubera TaxID=906938 RepID=A0AAV8HND3_9POAL|nr:Calmodulin [Rhynchospora pubera]
MCPSRRDPTTTLAELSPDLRPAFDVLDSDHDGRISLTDLKRFYSDLATPAPISDEEIAVMISTADADQNGFVDFDEFESVLTQRKRENGSLMEVFRLMDRDGDGKVGFEDLKAHLQMVGMRVGDEEVKAMIEMAGGALNGGVTFDGFENLLHGGF